MNTIMELPIWVLVIQSIVFGAFCGYIAFEKNRSHRVWFILGALFSIIALLALIAVPKNEEL